MLCVPAVHEYLNLSHAATLQMYTTYINLIFSVEDTSFNTLSYFLLV